MPVSTATMSPVNAFLNKDVLAVAQPNLVFGAMGTGIDMPEHMSSTVKSARFEKIQNIESLGTNAASLQLMTEGVTASETTFTRTVITLSLSQYGNLHRWTDRVSWENEWDVDEQIADRNAEDMAELKEQVERDGLLGGSTVFRYTDGLGGVNGAARVNVAGRLNAAALDKGYTRLRRYGARWFKNSVGASAKVGTTPLRNAYAVITHTDCENDLQQINQFSTYEKYAAQGDLMPGEYGAYGSLRFVTTQLARIYADDGAASTGGRSTTGTNADVYISLVFGKDAYAVVNLEHATEVFYTPHTQVDHSNELGQVNSIGYKLMCGSFIANDNWFQRHEHIISDFA